MAQILFKYFSREMLCAETTATGLTQDVLAKSWRTYICRERNLFVEMIQIGG